MITGCVYHDHTILSSHSKSALKTKSFLMPFQNTLYNWDEYGLSWDLWWGYGVVHGCKILHY